MNRIFLLSALLGLSFLFCKAQVPNGSFEVWNNMGTYENPDGWGTMNDATASASIFTAEKASPGNPGSYYLKLTSKTVGNSVVNGIAVSGVLDTLTMQPLSGFSFNQRPASFNGRWQHMIFGSSQGSIVVTLTRWDTLSSTRVPVATATKNLTGMAMSWANFSIPFTYTDGSYPDSCVIVMKASGSNPTQDDYLWVDNLTFVGTITAISPATYGLTGFSIAPNPGTGSTRILVDSNIEQAAGLELISANGAVLYSQTHVIQAGSNSIPVDFESLGMGSGLYFVKMTLEEGVSFQPLMIQ